MDDRKPNGLPAGGRLTRTDRMSPSVLVIEQDPLWLTAIGSVMNMQGYRCVLARTEELALQSMRTGRFDTIVLSIAELQHGCEFAHRLRSVEMAQDIPIIFLVPELSADWCSRLAHQGGVFSILKPFEPDALLELVERVLWMPHVARTRMGRHSKPMSRQRDWISLADS